MVLDRLLGPFEDAPPGRLEASVFHPAIRGEMDRIGELGGELPAEGGVGAADAVVLHVVEAVGPACSLELGVAPETSDEQGHRRVVGPGPIGVGVEVDHRPPGIEGVGRSVLPQRHLEGQHLSRPAIGTPAGHHQLPRRVDDEDVRRAPVEEVVDLLGEAGVPELRHPLGVVRADLPRHLLGRRFRRHAAANQPSLRIADKREVFESHSLPLPLPCVDAVETNFNGKGEGDVRNPLAYHPGNLYRRST